MKSLLIAFFLLPPVFASANVFFIPQPECWQRQDNILKEVKAAIKSLNQEEANRLIVLYSHTGDECLKAENIVQIGGITPSDEAFLKDPRR